MTYKILEKYSNQDIIDLADSLLIEGFMWTETEKTDFLRKMQEKSDEYSIQKDSLPIKITEQNVHKVARLIILKRKIQRLEADL